MSTWSLIYNSFEPEHEPLREALTTLGNGYFATRGASEECHADDIHYPGTYLAGGYNRLESLVSGHSIINEDLVNWPNWLPITFSCVPDQWFNLHAVEIISYRHELDLKNGILIRKIHFSDHDGRESTLYSRRIVNMDNPHYGAIEYNITAHNWSGNVTLKSLLDGSVINAGVARYRGLNSKHLNVIGSGKVNDNSIFIHVETTQSHIRLAEVARHTLYIDNQPIEVSPIVSTTNETISNEFNFEIKPGQTFSIEKVVAIYSSRDRAISECLSDAIIASQQAPCFTEMLRSHSLAWGCLWHRSDVMMQAKHEEQLILRLHIFHLLQTISLNSLNMDFGVPARGLHGEAYRGHIFWDELFIFPFYTHRIPEITRSLLMYRYYRLNMARWLAKESGYKGAMFPWQSSSNGQEETQIIHLNPRSNTWGPDLSHYQRHVNAAIVYNIWQYFLMTDNLHFIYTYGAEMILEIARFWESLTNYNEEKQRYVINNVVGPDEYHEKYPDSDEPGINNNAYTNFMAVWVFEIAIEVLSLMHSERCSELKARLSITEEEITLWQDITEKMFIPFHDNNVISQFEGYNDLKEFDWGLYLKKYENIERLDRILKAEEDSPNNYKVSKQADVLMLFYLFTKQTLTRIFHKLGYSQFDDTCIRKTIEYYEKRTSHGSTLSKIVFASELRFINEDAAREYFHEALISDISDRQGGTTPEGIHLGAMSGTLDIVMRQYAGIAIDKDNLYFNPHLPSDIEALEFRIQHRGNWYNIKINRKYFYLTLESSRNDKASVFVYDQNVILHLDKTRKFMKNDGSY